jgi:hypothetical protein
MQLKIQRSQRAGGVLANTVLFCLDIRADYSEEERSNINKYKLGGQVIYNSLAAKRHLDNAGAHLDRAGVPGFSGMAGGLARGVASLAMAKMSLNVTIASLGRGHHIECKDLQELLEGEDTLRNACKDLTRFLQVAETFDGSEVVVEYQNGEEQVHIIQHATPLLIESSATTVETASSQPYSDYGTSSSPFMENIGRNLGNVISGIETKLNVSNGTAKRILAGGTLVVLFILYEIF